jgi:hypothetical protein
MNLSKTGSLWLSKKLWVAVIVGLLLLLKLPTIHSAVDRSITTSGMYTIPAGVTAMIVDLWGAGGSGSGYLGTGKTLFAGGSGSYVRCQLAISGPGPTTITVIVGQGGLAPAYSAAGTNAFGGGGRGDADSNNSPGGGGGRSTIKNPSNIAEDWVTAGGGGGGGKTCIVQYTSLLNHYDVSYLYRYR